MPFGAAPLPARPCANVPLAAERLEWEDMTEPQPQQTAHPEPVFRGIGVALISLFDTSGSLLVDATAELAARLQERGVTAVLIGGTTGEFWTLTPDERLELAGAVRAALPTPVPLLLNVGAPSLGETLEMAAAFPDSGADAALCLTPPGVEPSNLYPQVRQRIGGAPLLAYHFPRAGFAPVGLEELADLVDGTKDSSGEAERLVATPELSAGVYTGSPLLLGLAAAIGVPGAILALANVEPSIAVAAFDGDLAALGELARLHRRSLSEAPPRAVKRMASERFGTSDATRPLTLRAALDAAR